MVNSNIFNIEEKLQNDNDIRSNEKIIFNPQTGTTYDNGEQINIIIENQNSYFLPSEAYLIIEGQITKRDGAAFTNADKIALVNNAPMFLFDRIEYRIEDRVIESINQPGKATLIKGMLSYLSYIVDTNDTMGFITDFMAVDEENETEKTNNGFATRMKKHNIRQKGSVQFLVPLKHIFGFCEDYQKVIYGVRHNLMFLRSNNDSNMFSRFDATIGIFLLEKLQLAMPKIVPSIEKEIKLMEIIKNKASLAINFRNRIFEEINVPTNQSFTWRLGSKIENISYIILSFQTNRENNYKNIAVFDHCDLEVIYVELNGVRYPNYSFVNNFKQFYYLPQYYDIIKFRQKYYGLKEIQNKVLVDEYNYSKFYPFFVIDLTKQDERLKNSAIDITIKANFRTNVKENTRCQCLMLSEKEIKLSSDGAKIFIS
jgi:hypothetical protein